MQSDRDFASLSVSVHLIHEISSIHLSPECNYYNSLNLEGKKEAYFLKILEKNNQNTHRVGAFKLLFL